MLFFLSFVIPTIIVILVIYYAYTLEVTLGYTEDALNRSRSQLKSEKEYVARLEHELLLTKK